MMIPWVSPGQGFPDLSSALQDPNGLLAASQTLTAQDILLAYRQGIFPWCGLDQPILWWSPDPRMVLFPDQVKISRSLKKSILKADYTISMDTHFEMVMRECAQPRKSDASTWIGEDFIAAYTQLHHQGIGHSVEIWKGNELVGGLYGLSFGQMFFGESMFSKKTDASKIALTFLCFLLSHYAKSLIDCQVANAHLASMGAYNMPRGEFVQYLSSAMKEEMIDWRAISDNMDHYYAAFLQTLR